MPLISNASKFTAHCGVTTLELAISIALVAIILAMGVPSFRDYGQERRMTAAVSQLHSGLVLARNEAINRQLHTVACPEASAGGCANHARWHGGWLTFADENGDREWQPGEPVLRRSGVTAGITVASTASRTRIRFFPGGSAPGSNATITFCDDRGPPRARQLRISASGRIRTTRATEVAEIDCDP
jgi:type IV fimbrial biogenesis protein FimT